MKVAIIAAMEEEVHILRDKIHAVETKTIAGYEFHQGQLGQCNVVVVKSGIGKVAAAMTASLLLSHFDIDLVINTGSAGGLASTLNIGDIIVSTDVCYHDVDLTVFGYQKGQMANCPETFIADEKLQKLATKTIQELNVNALNGLICSGDAFIHGDTTLKAIKENFPNVIAVEMEAAAIGHACWLFKTPFVVVRAISDVADKNSPMTFDEFLPIAAKQSSLVVEAMLQKIAK